MNQVCLIAELTVVEADVRRKDILEREGDGEWDDGDFERVP